MGIDFRKKDKTRLGAEKLEVQDLVRLGVIDPCLVVRNSLRYGASIASILLTAECAVLRETDYPLRQHDELHL